MPTAGEVHQLEDPSRGGVHLFVYLALAHGRELWEDLMDGWQLWLDPSERERLDRGGVAPGVA